MEDIESGLRALVEEVRKRNIHSIAIPPLVAALVVYSGVMSGQESKMPFRI